ncbi:prolipoprotein diacylglyceryl transferase family protein [Actibacterium pelagium]|nr:prolipoprotein diacylglyceryl transferase family protein [Actibacterium pelagium]
MSGFNIHIVFDLLAASLSLVGTYLAYTWRLRAANAMALGKLSTGYGIALVTGAAVGGYGLGSANLILSEIPMVGRSIVGALAGATLAIEIYKRFRGIVGSTGVIFVIGFTTTVAVGRIGCLLSGLEDQTHGIPTGASWGWDFGDGILRHPVQLYESTAMAVFLVGAVIALAVRSPFFLKNGFYLMVGFYAAQRFIWEFLKPYTSIAGPLNLFHFVCLSLIAYAIYMILRSKDART